MLATVLTLACSALQRVPVGVFHVFFPGPPNASTFSSTESHKICIVSWLVSGTHEDMLWPCFVTDVVCESLVLLFSCPCFWCGGVGRCQCSHPLPRNPQWDFQAGGRPTSLSNVQLHITCCPMNKKNKNQCVWADKKPSTSGLEPQPMKRHPSALLEQPPVSEENGCWFVWQGLRAWVWSWRSPPSSMERGALYCLLCGDNELQMLNWLIEFTACHFESLPGNKVLGWACTSSVLIY